MIDKLKSIYKEHKELILYVVFGGLTTLVNIGTHFILSNITSWPAAVCTTIAVILSVIFAYITNKLFVFESHEKTLKGLLREALSFFAARGVTAVIEIGLMALLVDTWHWPNMPTKICVTVIVIALNYIASKLWVFRKSDAKEEKANER